MQKRGGFDAERCCSCGASIETNDHLYQYPKQPQFQREILALIEEFQLKLAPHLFQTLYKGVKQYICKYENNPDDEGPNIESTIQFESIQSKFRIVEEYEAATSRKRKRSTRLNEPTYKATPLYSRQAKIGWDNMLRGKIDREWRIQQCKYEQLENRKEKDRNIKRKLDRIMINPYVHNKTEKHQNKKKKKKEKEDKRCIPIYD